MDSVLVVGGRTTGLMMAGELARRGVPTRCVDLSGGIDPHVRANLLHSRTLEIFQGLGLDAEVTQGSVAERGFVFYREGARVGESPHAPVDSPYPYGMSQSQAHTEAVMQAHLSGLGVEVERGVTLTAIRQDQDGVSVALQHPDGRAEACRFDWVIGCDGAHSALRHQLGIGFPGAGHDTPYILGDVLMSGIDHLAPDCGHIFFHPEGDLYVFTRLPKNRCFIIATLPPGSETTGTPDLAALQEIVARRAGPSLRLYDPHWLGHFRISYRLAQHYRRGRVFLAGDSAHIHSPLAGQGMNTGIQDAHNLAWKLALVAKGQARVALLETYEAERRRIAEDVLETTQQITNTMESYMGLSAEARDRFIADLLAPNPEQLQIDAHLQEIDLDYRDSALTHDTREGVEGGPAPGTRAPDAEDLRIAGRTTSLFWIPTDDQYRLLIFCGEAPGASAAEIEAAVADATRFAAWVTPYIVVMDPPLAPFDGHRVISDRRGSLHRRYGATGPCLYLIRPDGHVAYRSHALGSLGTYFDHLAPLMT